MPLKPSRLLYRLALLVTFAFVACDEANDLPISPSADSLVGEWTLVQLADGAVFPTATGEPATLVFGDGGRASGFAGCNRFSGSYELTSERLRFGALAMTRLACAAGMDLEQRYAQALERTQSYRVTGPRLELVGASGTVAVFQRR